MTPASLMIALTIMAGQLIKVPAGSNRGVTLLDLVVFILCLIGFLQVKLKLIKPPSFISWALLFSLTAFVSLILTPLTLTTQQYLLSLLYLIRFLLFIVLGWLLASNALISLTKFINQTLLISGMGLAILGLLQFIFLPDLRFLAAFGWDPHYFRTVSTFLDPNFAGAFFVLTLILLISQGKTKHIFFYLAYAALLTTFSRSSYLMFLISGLILSLLKKSKKLAVLVTILFICLWLGFQIYTQLVAKPRNIDREQSASYRLSTWQQGLIIFQKSPFLGIGFNTYKYAIEQFKLGDDQFLESRGSTSNDSSLLFVLATTGMLGFIVYLLFLISLLRVGNLYLVASLSGLLIHSVFANSLFYPPFLLWIMLVSSVPKK